MKEQIFKRVEKHLYKRQYQTANGDWSTLFYAIFTCWDGKRRTFKAGETLADARDELGRLRTLDKGRFGFDAEKRELAKLKAAPPERLTVGKRIPDFLKSKQEMKSYHFWRVCCAHLERLLGSVPLDEVTRAKILEYRALRQKESITRHGKSVEWHPVSSSTINREIMVLVGLLNHAAEAGLLEKLPAMRKLKQSEDDCARERVLDAEEYQALLAASPRWLQRVLIAAHEACLSRVDLLTLVRDELSRKFPETAMIKLAGGRNKTKAKQKIPISHRLPKYWASWTASEGS